MKHVQVAVVVRDAGAAIVVVEQDEMGEAVVTAIEPLALDLDLVQQHVQALRDSLENAQFVIDATGVGAAVWELLFDDERIVRDTVATRDKLPDGAPVGWLYEAVGPDRQALVNSLVLAVTRQTLHFVAGLAAQDQMTQALVGYRRTVKEDGEFGSALVVALALGLQPRLLPARFTAFLA